jgi:hypothetical protein
LWSCGCVRRAAKEIKTLNRALDIKLKDESPQGHTGDESSVATLVRRAAVIYQKHNFLFMSMWRVAE